MAKDTETPTHDTEPRAVSTVMLKGGTTKSTITGNAAEALARRGNDVLCIDTDPNGHLTVRLGFEDYYHDAPADLGDVLLSDGQATPQDIIQPTDLGFDFLPATDTLERVNSNLTDEMQPSLCLRRELVEPLLGEAYDYILIDTHSSPNMLVNNAVVAAPNLLLPVVPEEGVFSGLDRTRERIIEPLRDRLGLEILALVPNRLSERVDYQTGDRKLIERLCRSDTLSQYVPNFAYLSPATLDALDDGTYDGPLPKPGIREDKDIGNASRDDVTLGAYAPDNPQLAYFDELAAIIERGEVVRDG